MRPLFQPGSDTLFRLALAGAAAFAGAVPVAMMLWVRTPYVTKEDEPVVQPIAFDHRHHVRDRSWVTTENSPRLQLGQPCTGTCLWPDQISPYRGTAKGRHY